ncbi:MAG: YbhB/YbcL family Raf kinase inhibitor-like protein [Gammaproteobacteria bacterium]
MRSRTSAALALLFGGLLFVTAVQAQQPPAGGGPPPQGQPRRGLVPLLIESTAFPDGGIVPDKYSFRGGNTQPDFKISNAPADTQSFAIILHDIDVGIGGPDDVLHWVAFNIPGTTKEISEGKLPEGSVTGKNMRDNNYMGPGAPPGPRYHHYVFEFYALSEKLDLPATASRPELLAAMKGKVIAKAAYVGRFRGTPAPNGAPAGGPPPAAR